MAAITKQGTTSSPLGKTLTALRRNFGRGIERRFTCMLQVWWIRFSFCGWSMVKDPKAAVAQRLRACELQTIIGGFTGGRNESKSGSSRNGQETPSRHAVLVTPREINYCGYFPLSSHMGMHGTSLERLNSLERRMHRTWEDWIRSSLLPAL